MVLAFLLGGAIEYARLPERCLGTKSCWKKLRVRVYQVVVTYLLFKIGFSGGKAIASEGFGEVIIPALIAILVSILWTLFVVEVLRRWSRFDSITQTSIASHFGSVSVGTFIAGLAFLEALGIPVTPSVAVWLALMELPAILVGMWRLRITPKTLLKVIKEDLFLWVLVGSIFIGYIGYDWLPPSWQEFLFVTIFAPILMYFLFEMGRKAEASLGQLRDELGAIVLIGIIVPVIGGTFGIGLGNLMGYGNGEAFMLAILIASASYVLAPISMHEILKSMPDANKKRAEKAVSVSMALSVGVALPFNILIGFEVYKLLWDSTQIWPQLSWVYTLLPVMIMILARIRF